jgi:shikimate kinase
MIEALTQAEFDARRDAENLAITVVGMSNVGKTLWSKRLAADEGFDVIGCDDLIEAELGTTLQRQGFAGGIADMARWMGQPFEPQFPANESSYLYLEKAIMRRALDRISQPQLGGNIVIDTTGSVVHTGPGICQSLRLYSTVVYLEATAEMQEEMFRRYIAEPKPVVWEDIYQASEGQSFEETLATCYPALLEHRATLYRQMAQVTVPMEVSYDLTTGGELLDFVRDSLL